MASLFVVTAPSGAGKTSLVAALLQREPGLRLSVSYTTRAPRPADRDGVDYHFVTPEVFAAMVAADDFLEHALVHGNHYGTSRRWIEAQLADGHDVLLEIDWQGAAQVRRFFPAATGIFILPPSAAALQERLVKRGSDSPATIARRLAGAREEIAHVFEFEYIIVNDDFEAAAEALTSIVRARRVARDAVQSDIESIIQQFR